MANTQNFAGWRRVFYGLRTRIIMWYVILMTCSTTLTVFAVRQVLSVRIEERSKQILVQEVKEFRQLLEGYREFGCCEVESLFDDFLSRNIPVDGEFMVTFVDGKFYKASPTALPGTLVRDKKLLKRWSRVIRPERGEKITPNDNIRYFVQPVNIDGEKPGVFVVMHSTESEWQKLNEVTVVMVLVTLMVLIVASVVIWAVGGRLLRPLRLLTATAHSISGSNVGERIAVQGSDDIAELTITFNAMLDRLEAAFTSQRNFINDAGHELKTPITIIRGHLELLGDDPEEQKETLAIVTDELDRMSRLVNDLLLLAKAERPDFLNLETVDVEVFTEELLAKAKALGDRHWQIESQAFCLIVADRQRLTQAMMNLAQNAVQHTKREDAIFLGSGVRNNQVFFWVRDTGEGIPPSEQKRIFERFARVANSRRRSEGYGLGLAIVKAIVEAHEGRVELNSELGKGATFMLILPLEFSSNVK
ncbi:HAMP domain-containing histidine kinase [Phormidium sp. LEGE 05292]|uniref:sensor histidine kinase n=1 Tax=[Phormidium] sp. LEGE 05292 TaxID=767427 RepID=UPI001882BBD7|nr:HAMP domain-containing sensor histidine kinase [Phormidium sp. LEGE 05292]MBE9227452.1 HAMP domain-containing histidine kinase [Phormidium sp. LEGE 05292]